MQTVQCSTREEVKQQHDWNEAMIERVQLSATSKSAKRREKEESEKRKRKEKSEERGEVSKHFIVCWLALREGVKWYLVKQRGRLCHLQHFDALHIEFVERKAAAAAVGWESKDDNVHMLYGSLRASLLKSIWQVEPFYYCHLLKSKRMSCRYLHSLTKKSRIKLCHLCFGNSHVEIILHSKKRKRRKGSKEKCTWVHYEFTWGFL